MAELTPFTNALGESYLNQYDFTPHAYTRTQPVQGWVQEAIANAVYSVDPDLQIRVTSGGQTSERDPSKKGAANGWIGTTRHNGGEAADFALVRDEKVLPVATNKALYLAVAQNLAAQGVPGIGVDTQSNFIHAGGGSEAAWGYNGGSNGARFLDPDFAAAIQEGRSMFKSGGIPQPPGMIPNPPGAAVATQLATAVPKLPVPPQSQSNALARERSMISPDAPPALKAGLARMASEGARTANLPMPATPSTAMMAARSPNLIPDTFGRILPPVPPQPLAADMRVTRKNPVTPFLTRDGQGVTDPAALVFGDMQTNIGLPGVPRPPSQVAPMPAQQSPHLAARRATDPVLQAALNARLAPPKAAPVPFDRPSRLAAPVPFPRPSFLPQVATQLAVTPPRVAPVPMPLAMRPTAPARAPLQIVVNGANSYGGGSPSSPSVVKGHTASGGRRYDPDTAQWT